MEETKKNISGSRAIFYTAVKSEPYKTESISGNCERYTGYNAEKFLNGSALRRNIIVSAHQNTHEDWIKNLESVHEGSLKYMIRTENNIEKYVTEFAAVSRNPDGAEIISGRIFFDEVDEPHFSGDLYKKIYDTSADGVIVADKDLRIISWNRALEELSGYTAEEVIGEKLSDVQIKLMPPEIRTDKYVEYFLKELEKYNKQGDAPWLDKITEHKIITKEGKIKYVQSITGRFISEGSEFTASIIRDITEKQNSVDALEESEERFKTLVEIFPEGMIVHANGKCVFANRAAADILGAGSIDEIIGRDVLDAVHPDYLEKVKQRIEQSYIERKPANLMNEKFIRIDGKTIDVEVTAVPTTWKSEPASQLIFRNITGRKRIEENLKKARDEAERLAAIVPSAVFTVNQDNIVTGWNRRAALITGYQPEEIIGKECRIFAESPCKEHCGLYDEKIEKPIYGRVCRIRTKGGRILHISKNADLIKDEEGNITGGIESFEDVTEQVKARQTQNAINDIAVAALTTENLHSLYKRVHEIVNGLIPARNFYIAIYNDEDETIAFPYYVDKIETDYKISYFKPEKYENSLTELLIKQGKPLLINDEYFEDMVEDGEVKLIGGDSREWLGVPLMSSTGKIIGAVVAQIYDENTHYTEEDKSILSFVSNQIAIAIERKRAEDSLKNYSAKLAFHIQKTPFAYIEWNSRLEVTDWNPAAEKMFGFSKKEALGKNAWELLSDGHYLSDSNEDELYDIENGKYQINTRSGKKLDTEWYNTPLRDADGTMTGIASLIQNISERVKYEKVQNALYKISDAINSTDNLNVLFKEIHEIIKGLMPADNFYISLYDKKSDIISFPYFVDTIDQTPLPKKLGRGLTEYIYRTGKSMLIDEMIDHELREKGEVDLIGEPTKIWLGIILKVVDKKIGVMVLQDYKNADTYGEEEKQLLTFVSEQIALAIEKKRADEELKEFMQELQYNKDLLEERNSELVIVNQKLFESEAQLKEMNAAKDKFFSIIAHDLKSPFIGLMGFSEILADSAFELSTETIQDYSNRLKMMVKNVYSLIENLLQWSRIQTDRIEVQSEEFNLTKIIANITDIYEVNADNKNINLSYKAGNDIKVYADREMISTVLRNLISNSLKFTPEGGTITVIAETGEREVVITVKDSGVGIDIETQQNLFKIDTNTSTEGTAGEEGTGLGLILCKEFVEMNGGKIWVESEPGEGSQFTFTLKKIKDQTD